MRKIFLNKTKNVLAKTTAAIGVACLLTFSSFAPKSETILSLQSAVASSIVKEYKDPKKAIKNLYSKGWKKRKIGKSDLVIIGRPAVPLLLKALSSRNMNNQAIDDTIEVLTKIGKPAIPLLIKALKGNLWLHSRSAKTIGKIGVDKTQFQTIVRMLRNGRICSEKAGAAAALGEIKDPKAMPVLIVDLRNQDQCVRNASAIAIEEITKANPGDSRPLSAIPALINNLNDRSNFTADALGAIIEKNPGKPKCIKAVSPLIKLLRGNNTEGQYNAAWLIGEIAKANPRSSQTLKAAPFLLKSLKSKNVNVRGNAAYALGEIAATKAGRKRMRNVASLLKCLLNDKSSFVREKATVGLGRIGNSRTISALVRSLKDKDDMVRLRAAQSIEKIIKKSSRRARFKKFVPKLIEALNYSAGLCDNFGKCESVQLSSVRALEMINDPRALPALFLLRKKEKGKFGKDRVLIEATENAIKSISK